MKQEISIAIDLLITYIQRYGSIKDEIIERFRQELEHVLLKCYEGHWYPDKPIKGQAYRSLEFNKENQFCDTIIAQVCRQLGFTPDLLGIHHELTLWIDPCEVSIRLGNHVSPKDNQQLIVARFDQQGNKLLHQDLDTLFFQSRLPLNSKSPRSSPTTTLPISQPSMFRNEPLFTPPRALSPQAPVFQMTSSNPINVPLQSHLFENSIEIFDENNSFNDDNQSQPERSDTPHSMNSTTSNESSDSGYCGYVESYPYYYKLNRLYKALALQKHTGAIPRMNKTAHHHRRFHNPNYHQQQQQQQQEILSSSPPTPTPYNIDQLAPFYAQQLVPSTSSRKPKY